MTFGGQCDEARSHAILDAAGSLVNMSMATLAVAWVLSNPAINAPIVGASRPEQLADSLAAAEMDRLPTDLKVSLDELTHGRRLVDADRRSDGGRTKRTDPPRT
jgi:aryl-alcohol dehydrogenase-like predicted oxidoreductase